MQVCWVGFINLCNEILACICTSSSRVDSRTSLAQREEAQRHGVCTGVSVACSRERGGGGRGTG